jgi:hypothetical protein
MDFKASSMENRTAQALESGNPFASPLPARLAQPKPQPAPQPEPVAEPKRRGRKPKVKEEVTTVQSFNESTSLADISAPREPDASELIQESRSADGLPSYRCEFAGRDIFVGWPWYKTSNPVTAAVNVALALDFGRDKIRFDMSIGDAMVYHSRNLLVHKFLQTEAKWILMMDDDIIPSIGRPEWIKNWVVSARRIPDVALKRHVLHRLIGSGKSIIGGAYFGRQEGGRLMCSNLALEADARAYSDRIVPVDWVATGCMLVHRKVFDAIREQFPQLAPEKAGEPFDYFHPISSKMGEDVSFCQRAKQAGHQPHIDLGIPVFHVGYKVY